mgnify:CR=1 FL=1
MKKKDIFDRIMSLPILNTFYPLYSKYKEQLLYLFFGGCTFIVSIVSYKLALAAFAPLLANIISWIFAVAFAYVTNRIWVFSGAATDSKGIVREVISFASGRLVTLGLEEIILAVGINLLHLDSMLVKVVGQVIVIVSYYFIRISRIGDLLT